MRFAARAKAMRALMEIGLKDRFQYQHQRHLHHAVFERGDSKRSLRSVGFRDIDSFNRARAVGPSFELLVDLREELLLALLLVEDVFRPDSVDSSRLLPFADLLPCRFQHVHPVDPVVERIKTELRLLLRFLIQLPSQLPQLLRQQLHLGRVPVQISAVGYSVMDLWVKRLHGVWIVARSQSIPLAPGGLGLSQLLWDRPTPAWAPLPSAGLSGSLASLSLRAASSHPEEPAGCVLVSLRWQTSASPEAWSVLLA